MLKIYQHKNEFFNQNLRLNLKIMITFIYCSCYIRHCSSHFMIFYWLNDYNNLVMYISLVMLRQVKVTGVVVRHQNGSSGAHSSISKTTEIFSDVTCSKTCTCHCLSHDLVLHCGHLPSHVPVLFSPHILSSYWPAFAFPVSFTLLSSQLSSSLSLIDYYQKLSPL